uniref:Serine/threonine-protein phosphatase n=1 Tax=Piliocolobus tephrosceles TaxID=591936 RepID=A0A8C9GYL5_9PRIM
MPKNETVDITSSVTDENKTVFSTSDIIQSKKKIQLKTCLKVENACEDTGTDTYVNTVKDTINDEPCESNMIKVKNIDSVYLNISNERNEVANTYNKNETMENKKNKIGNSSKCITCFESSMHFREDNDYELEQEIGQENGKENGQENGKENGQENGKENGQENGKEIGQEIGQENGKEIGQEVGQENGQEVGQENGQNNDCELEKKNEHEPGKEYRHVTKVISNDYLPHFGYEHNVQSVFESRGNTMDMSENGIIWKHMSQRTNAQTGEHAIDQIKTVITKPNKEEPKYNSSNVTCGIKMTKSKSKMSVERNIAKLTEVVKEYRNQYITDNRLLAMNQDIAFKIFSNVYNVCYKKKRSNYKKHFNHFHICSYNDILLLCDEVVKALKIENTLEHANLPCKIFGDIHGQLFDIIDFFNKYSWPMHDTVDNNLLSVNGIQNLNDQSNRNDSSSNSSSSTCYGESSDKNIDCNGDNRDEEKNKKYYNNNNVKYIFLGNYINRGEFSLEVICFLFSLKILFPKHIYLLRGNHEDRLLNYVYGFYENIIKKMKVYLKQNAIINYQENTIIAHSYELFNRINDVFEFLPLSILLDKSILCIHGGIGDSVESINDYQKIDKPILVPQYVDRNSNYKKEVLKKIIIDTLWSDPINYEDELDLKLLCNNSPNAIDVIPSNRGSLTVKFGINRLRNFLKKNKLKLIIRGNEWNYDGYRYDLKRKIMTVFSATNYCNKYGNKGANVFIFKKDNDIIIVHQLLNVPSDTACHGVTKENEHNLTNTTIDKSSIIHSDWENIKNTNMSYQNEYINKNNNWKHEYLCENNISVDKNDYDKCNVYSASEQNGIETRTCMDNSRIYYANNNNKSDEHSLNRWDGIGDSVNSGFPANLHIYDKNIISQDELKYENEIVNTFINSHNFIDTQKGLKVSKIKKTENFNDQMESYVRGITDSSCSSSNDNSNRRNNKNDGKKTLGASTVDNCNIRDINKLISDGGGGYGSSGGGYGSSGGGYGSSGSDKFNSNNRNISKTKNENVVNTSDITNLHFKSKNNRLYQNENEINYFNKNYNWDYNKNDLDDVKKVHYTKLTSILNENNFDIIKNNENSQYSLIGKVQSVNGLSYLQQKPLNYMMPPDLAPQKKNKKYSNSAIIKHLKDENNTKEPVNYLQMRSLPPDPKPQAKYFIQKSFEQVESF